VHYLDLEMDSESDGESAVAEWQCAQCQNDRIRERPRMEKEESVLEVY